MAVVGHPSLCLQHLARGVWPLFLEDDSEIMLVAILVAILIGSLGRVTRYAGQQQWGCFLVLATALTIVIAILASQPTYKYKWGSGPPDYYTGTIASIEQDFSFHHPFLSRIDVWSFVQSGSAEQAEVLMRLTPQGAAQPVRESNASARYID